MLKPSNVLATLALFLSLSGVSYAAVQLPKNSVGTSQIRSGAVTSGKVRPGSLTSSTLSPGTLQKGPIGEPGAAGQAGGRGPAGPGGQTGTQGAQGPAGADGLSLYATVTAGGNLVAGASHGAVSATRTAVGRYAVVFNHTLAGCQVFGGNSIGAPDANWISASVANPSGEVVNVRAVGGAAQYQDSPFQLAVFCP